MSTTTVAPPDEEIEIGSPQELEDVIEELGDAQSELSSKKAEREKELRKLDRKYSPQIERRQAKVDALLEAAVKYCQEHKGELLEGADGKTVDFLTGTVEFRAGKPKVRFTDKKANIIERLKAAGKGDLVVVKETLYKSQLKKHRSVCEAIEGLEYVEGEESITIKPLEY